MYNVIFKVSISNVLISNGYALQLPILAALIDEDRFPLLVGTLLTAITFGVFGGYVLARRKAWLARSLTTRGTVVRLETDRAGELVKSSLKGKKKSGPRRVWPVFQYHDHAGATHQRRSTRSFARGSVAIADEVTLYYRRDRPFAARMDDRSEVRVAVGALVAAAICVVAIVVSFAF